MKSLFDVRLLDSVLVMYVRVYGIHDSCLRVQVNLQVVSPLNGISWRVYEYLLGIGGYDHDDCMMHSKPLDLGEHDLSLRMSECMS